MIPTVPVPWNCTDYEDDFDDWIGDVRLFAAKAWPTAWPEDEDYPDTEEGEADYADAVEACEAEEARVVYAVDRDEESAALAVTLETGLQRVEVAPADPEAIPGDHWDETPCGMNNGWTVGEWADREQARRDKAYADAAQRRFRFGG